MLIGCDLGTPDWLLLSVVVEADLGELAADFEGEPSRDGTCANMASAMKVRSVICDWSSSDISHTLVTNSWKGVKSEMTK